MNTLSRRTAASAALLIAATSLSVPAGAAPSTATRIASYSAGPTTVVKGHSILIRGQAQRLSGKTWVAAPGASAVVYFDPDGARPNAAVRTVKANAKGVFSTSIVPSVSGVWTVRIAQTGTLKTSSTGRVAVRVVVPAPKPAPRPTSVRYPSGTYTCPGTLPIKGNLNSHIYHVPGGAFYGKTRAEYCFANESTAVKAGFRRSKR